MTVPRKWSTLTRSTPLKAMNVERYEKNWTRAYGSLERVCFVKRLPCIACGVRRCHNSHIANGGTSRKADHTLIVPCCREHHDELDNGNGREAFAEKYAIDLHALAAETEQRWQVYAARMGYEL